ncbi:MAG: HAD family hydrolase [Acidimicrobiia bacterium]
MTAKRAVIFDYGGVLTGDPFGGMADFETEMGYPEGSLLRLLFGRPRRYEEADTAGTGPNAGRNGSATLGRARTAYEKSLDAAPGTIPDWHLLETGKLSLADFHRRLVERSADHLGAPLAADFFDRFLATLALAVNWTVIHRIRELRADGYRTAILTNNIKEWREVWKASIPMDLFDVVIDSSEVGLRKPEPAIFELTCERLGVDPAAAVFLDDSPRHVAAAEAAGLTGIVVTDPTSALAALDEILAAP